VMWVGLLTVILNYICAVFLTQTLGHDADAWGDQAYKIERWFGTIGHSMRTLFIIITLAEWDEIALVVSEHVNGFCVFALAIAYITLTAFTMVSLITGIISEELVGAQRDDEDHKLQQIEKGKVELASSVKSLLKSFDDDSNGSLSPEEVKRALGNPDLMFMERLKALNIAMDIDDFLSLVHRLKEAVGTEEIPIENIADALKHLSGDASSSSIWDVKMLLLSLQNEGTQTRVGGLPEQVDKHKEDVSSSSSVMRDKVDAAIARLATVEQRFQNEHSRINSTIGNIMDQVDRLETLQQDKCRSGDNVIERLDQVEDLMQQLCSRMANGDYTCSEDSKLCAKPELPAQSELSDRHQDSKLFAKPELPAQQPVLEPELSDRHQEPSEVAMPAVPTNGADVMCAVKPSTTSTVATQTPFMHMFGSYV